MISSKSVHLCGLGASRKIKQKNFKGIYLRNHNGRFFHMFAQTTHVVASPHRFARVGIPAIDLVIYSKFHRNPFRVFGAHNGVKIWSFPLLWLLAFTIACTVVLVQAVIVNNYRAITLSFVFSKIFEHCFMLKYDRYFFAVLLGYLVSRDPLTKRALFCVRKASRRGHQCAPPATQSATRTAHLVMLSRYPPADLASQGPSNNTVHDVRTLATTMRTGRRSEGRRRRRRGGESAAR